MPDCPSISSGSSYGLDDVVQIAEPLTLEFVGEVMEDSSSSDAAARSLQLSWSCSRYIVNRIDGIRIRVWVSEAVGMTDKIFAYLMTPKNPTTAEKEGVFDHVCSPVDLAEYPEDAPIENSRPAWFRLDYVDLHLRSREEADDFLARVKLDAGGLRVSLDIMEVIAPTGTEDV
jgi:hypothetical protein